MLGVSTEAIFTGFASPAVLAVIGWVINRHFSKLDETLTTISTSIVEIKIKAAVTEAQAFLFDEVRKETKELREDLTKQRASLEAAWRTLDVSRTSSGKRE